MEELNTFSSVCCRSISHESSNYWRPSPIVFPGSNMQASKNEALGAHVSASLFCWVRLVNVASDGWMMSQGEYYRPLYICVWPMSYCRVMWPAHELLAMCCTRLQSIAYQNLRGQCMSQLHPIYAPLPLPKLLPHPAESFISLCFFCWQDLLQKLWAVPSMDRCMHVDR